LELLWSVLVSVVLGCSSDLAVDTVKLILGEELWNVTGSKNIIDEDKESVINNLRVSKEEESMILLDSSSHEESLDVSLQIGYSIVGGDDNSEDFVGVDEGSELGKRLLS